MLEGYYLSKFSVSQIGYFHAKAPYQFMHWKIFFPIYESN